MITVPEIVVYTIIESLFKFLKTDFEEKADETTTLLYNMFFGKQIGNYNYYDQARELFLRDEGDPSTIQLRMFFDRSRAGLPTVHITLPSELPGADGIGVDEGYEDCINVIEDEEIVGVIPVLTRSFNTQFGIIITSSSTWETLLIYHALKNTIISAFRSFDLSGMRNPKLSGQDINLNDYMAPDEIYSRSLVLEFMYETSVQQLFGQEFLDKIFVGNVTATTPPYSGVRETPLHENG